MNDSPVSSYGVRLREFFERATLAPRGAYMDFPSKDAAISTRHRLSKLRAAERRAMAKQLGYEVPISWDPIVLRLYQAVDDGAPVWRLHAIHTDSTDLPEVKEPPHDAA